MLEHLDRNAVVAGALWCLAIAVPAAVIQAVLADDDGGTDQSPWVFVALAAIVFAYLLGGAIAGARVPDWPFVNGAAATVAAFAVVQFIGIVVRVARGDGVSFVALVFNALLAASIGAIGAGFGARRAARTAEGHTGGDGESSGWPRPRG